MIMWLSPAEYVLVGCLLLISYTYFIYPAISAAIGGSKSELEESELPGISVLVPAYNEAEVIGEKIENFIGLDYPRKKIEMLIVDDGSIDNTREIIRSKLTDNIRLLDPKPRSGKATGLNRMVAMAEHPFLLFCDANVLFSPEAPKKLANHMIREEVGAVTGHVQLIGSNSEFESGESMYYQIEQRIQEAESRIGSVMGVDGGMYLLRRELFKPLQPNTILDDFAISMQVMRSGYRIIYDGDIKAKECGTPTSVQEYKRRVRMMAGVIQILRWGLVPRWSQGLLWFQFISHKILRWITPLLLCGTFFSSVLLAADGQFYQFIFLAQLFTYSAFIILCAYPKLRRRKIGSIVFYFFMSQVAVTEGLFKGLTGRHNVRWEKGSRRQSTCSQKVTR